MSVFFLSREESHFRVNSGGTSLALSLLLTDETDDRREIELLEVSLSSKDGLLYDRVRLRKSSEDSRREFLVLTGDAGVNLSFS